MLRIGIIIGSTRPGRNGEAVAKWIFELAQQRSDAQFELVDLLSFNLPLLDEPIPAAQGKYSQQHTINWAAKIDSLDAFVFVTPEYNHSISGALKNAIDFLYKEWNNKVAGIVSYGSSNGIRAAEHLRLIAAELQIATVREQVMFSLYTDFKNFSEFAPADMHKDKVSKMLDQVIAWGEAIKQVRSK